MGSVTTSPTLFQPVSLGSMTLSHRVVLAPLTRQRGDFYGNPSPLAKEYYTQRTCEPGTLLITEGTFIERKAGGKEGVPGIWNQEQMDRWREIAEGVHEKGNSWVFMQLWALGRAASRDLLEVYEKEGEDECPYVSSSPTIMLSGVSKSPPRALTKEEIKEYVELYAQAAVNAVQEAGLDGVELHAANGYLVDQFTQDVCNKRTDEYGGNVEGRCRFALEVVDRICERVGEERVAIRLSPWSYFQEMRMDDPIPTFTYLVTQLKTRHPNLAYLHLVEPRIKGNADADSPDSDTNDVFRKLWAPKTLITAGGFTRESAIERAEHEGDLIAFGRYFISNPDIVRRLKEDIPLTPYDRETFYLVGEKSPRGYTDYPFVN